MSKQPDLKKEWGKAKEQLTQFGKEAMDLAKKGEKEFVKFSRRSKLQLDSTAMDLKREQLYYLIGREYVRANAPERPTEALGRFLGEVEKVNDEQKKLRIKLKNIQ
ncbi:MAG: hypothetical protein HZA28_08985 [Candidatus Omnitrophica bacterium]|nr:hypothetical protein [Candidatus Omnitrophota bacterium]